MFEGNCPGYLLKRDLTGRADASEDKPLRMELNSVGSGTPNGSLEIEIGVVGECIPFVRDLIGAFATSEGKSFKYDLISPGTSSLPRNELIGREALPEGRLSKKE
jgi:hypothetical protein